MDLEELDTPIPAHEKVDQLQAEVYRLRNALGGLVSWIDGWRDTYADGPEERWKPAFTDTTAELVVARRVLAEGVV